MEESKALHKLLEIADLIGMVEDMLTPASSDRLSSASWSGMRITLRNVREMVQHSHSTLAGDLVNRSRAIVQASSSVSAPAATSSDVPAVRPSTTEEKTLHSIRSESPISARPVNGSSEHSRIQMTRRDLKASLEKVIDR